MTTLQLFCTVSDLIADKQAPGVDDQLYRGIQAASDFLQKEIGHFIPVTLTHRLNGMGRDTLWIPPMLSITSIVNDGTTLETTDYILKPDNGFWPNGPYTRILVDPDAVNLTTWVDEEDGVVLTGPTGLYSRTGAIGATVQDTTEQSSSQTTLKVSDGSTVSPGMILLIGTEQQAVTGWSTPTTSVTTCNGAVTATADTVTLANGALVSIGEVVRVDFEQMKIKDKNGHVCEMIRGWNGTRKVEHLTGAAVDVYRTVTVERGINGTTAAVHANGTAISRHYVPDDILFLCKEIATLMANKALSGYQGRTGNQETGVVFYNDAFPKYDIEQVRKNYTIRRVE